MVAAGSAYDKPGQYTFTIVARDEICSECCLTVLSGASPSFSIPLPRIGRRAGLRWFVSQRVSFGTSNPRWQTVTGDSSGSWWAKSLYYHLNRAAPQERNHLRSDNRLFGSGNTEN